MLWSLGWTRQGKLPFSTASSSRSLSRVSPPRASTLRRSACPWGGPVE
ncbi:hypothetical protein LEMLEM_LOCUS27493 [Lemmus lemmus]